MAVPIASRWAGVASLGGEPDRGLERERGLLRLVDPGRVLRQPQRHELRPELREVAAARALLRQLAERGDRDGLADERMALDRLTVAVECEPARRSPTSYEHR